MIVVQFRHTLVGSLAFEFALFMLLISVTRYFTTQRSIHKPCKFGSFCSFEIAQYSPYYLPLNVFTASKGSNLYILIEDFGEALA